MMMLLLLLQRRRLPRSILQKRAHLSVLSMILSLLMSLWMTQM